MQHKASIGTTLDVVLDRTGQTPKDYNRLVAEEIEHYDGIAVTDQLTEGGIHAYKSWEHYFQYLYNNYFKLSFYEAVWRAVEGREAPTVLSLGCGYGGHDLEIARKLRSPYELIAVDLNPRVYDTASRRAEAEGLHIRFQPLDLNRVALRPGHFDVIYAVASIHHILNLEHLFEQLHRGLKDDGRLVVLDIIGKTQVEFWRENVEYAAEVVRRLPSRYRPPVGRRFWRRWLFDPYTIIPRFIEPQIQEGMEGIRQEEIVPLLERWFQPQKLFYYDAYMRILCTNWFLGPRLDPRNDEDRKVLEWLIDQEMEVISSGKLRPTEVFGIYTKKAV
jgi:SAM-dependent methyltransferase